MAVMRRFSGRRREKVPTVDLCNDDYWYPALLPVIGQALSKFPVGTSPTQVQAATEIASAIFWHCYNNRWPCCGEPDFLDACLARADIVVRKMFQSGDAQVAIQSVVSSISGMNLRNDCPTEYHPGVVVRARRR